MFCTVGFLNANGLNKLIDCWVIENRLHATVLGVLCVQVSRGIENYFHCLNDCVDVSWLLCETVSNLNWLINTSYAWYWYKLQMMSKDRRIRVCNSCWPVDLTTVTYAFTDYSLYCTWCWSLVSAHPLAAIMNPFLLSNSNIYQGNQNFKKLEMLLQLVIPFSISLASLHYVWCNYMYTA